MDIKSILLGIGLSEEQSNIYLTALELGSGTATQIATKANVQRTYFYHLSGKLIERGLLRQSKQGSKTLFYAESPERLLEIEKKKLSLLEKKLPELMAITNITASKPKVYYYEGIAGINYINEDTLRFKGEIVGFTTPRYVSLDQGELHRNYVEKRLLSKNKGRVIGEASKEIVELQKRDKEEMRETRMLPKEIFHSEIEIIIYGDRMAIVDYKETFGLIIEGKEITNTLKQIFELVWNSGRILT